MPDYDDALIAATRQYPRLRTLGDYEDALSRVVPYLAHPPERGTPAGEVLYVLLGEIAAYETKHFPLESDPGVNHFH